MNETSNEKEYKKARKLQKKLALGGLAVATGASAAALGVHALSKRGNKSDMNFYSDLQSGLNKVKNMRKTGKGTSKIKAEVVKPENSLNIAKSYTDVEFKEASLNSYKYIIEKAAQEQF